MATETEGARGRERCEFEFVMFALGMLVVFRCDLVVWKVTTLTFANNAVPGRAEPSGVRFDRQHECGSRRRTLLYRHNQCGYDY
jgi:hypothetical protein